MPIDSRRTGRPRTLLLGGMGVCAIVIQILAATSASAAAPDKSGWWVQPTGGVELAPPDVPAGGLLVEGGTSESSPQAIAAVDYTIDVGDTPDTLTLHVTTASASVPTATVKACPLTSDFTAASGADIASAPKYECTHAVTGTRSPDGSTVTLNVAGLADGGHLQLALLPTAPTDRLVFDAPGANSLTLVAGSPTPSSAGQPSQQPTSSALSPVGVISNPGTVAAPPALGSVPTTAQATPTPPAAPLIASETQAQATTQFTNAADGHDTGFGLPLGWLLAAGTAAATVLWRAAGAESPLTREAGRQGIDPRAPIAGPHRPSPSGS